MFVLVVVLNSATILNLAALQKHSVTEMHMFNHDGGRGRGGGGL